MQVFAQKLTGVIPHPSETPNVFGTIDTTDIASEGTYSTSYGRMSERERDGKAGWF